MKAILETRCGCSRMLDIPEPAQRFLRLPLKVKVSFMPPAEDLELPRFDTREFELQQFERLPIVGGARVAIYRERP